MICSFIRKVFKQVRTDYKSMLYAIRNDENWIIYFNTQVNYPDVLAFASDIWAQASSFSGKGLA